MEDNLLNGQSTIITPPQLSSHSSQASPSCHATAGKSNTLSPDACNKPRSASVNRLGESPDGKNKTSPVSKTLEVTQKPRSNSASPANHKPRLSGKKKSDNVELPEAWVLEEFTEEQLDKIKQFRNGPAAEYISPLDTDLQIFRWLTARKFDITESSKMFIESKKWRKTENMDNITEWIQNIKPFQFLSDYWPNSLLPGKNNPKLRTHDGYLIIYEKLAEVHPDILDIISLDDMVKFHLYIQEICNKELMQIAEEKKGYAGIVFVYDLSALTMNHLSRANYHMFQVFHSFDCNNYPESLRRVYLINAPQVFTIGWKFAKKFLDPVTLKKIVILGSDYKQELLKVIPDECLPTVYGGKLDYLPSGGGPIKGIKKFS